MLHGIQKQRPVHTYDVIAFLLCLKVGVYSYFAVVLYVEFRSSGQALSQNTVRDESCEKIVLEEVASLMLAVSS